MVRHLEPPPAEFTTPPGTVRLLGEDGVYERPQLLLHPVPSDDPNDPLNWSAWRKVANFVPILAITCAIFTQTSLPLIFWVLWIPEFGWTYDQLNNSQAIGLVGTATGCIFFIPLAIKYGRRSVYVVSIAVIVATAAWQARMTTIAELYLSTFIFGLANAVNETIVQMTIADLYFIHHRGTANGAYMVMVMIGSFLSPIAGGYMADGGNWRQCFWVLFAIEAALWIYFCLFFEESKYIPRIEALRQESPEPSLSSASKKLTSDNQTQTATAVSDVPDVADDHVVNPAIPLLTWRQRLKFITKTDESLWKCAYTPLIVLFRFPAVAYTAVQYAFSLCWISAQASVISIAFAAPPYNYGPAGIGNMSLGIFLGCILGSIYGGVLSDRTVLWLARRNYGYYEPEMRLHLLHFPALCLGGGLIMFGITTQKGMHWIYPSLGGGIFGFGMGSISDIALCLLMDSYQTVTGEAFVAVTFVRNCVSIAIYFALVPWMDAQGIQNMFIVMGFWGMAVGFIHVAFILWGKRWRENTAPMYWKMCKEREGSRA
ncbi:major facilitator superfamily domain-containing protein [Dactylonectria estremocensis]|uniref:Major facilitator superfamily domain-containing protein n=1 Tax=Dactylonectria estremocensis TaxID=1079267 RepID=A0A9P9EIN5_9HYPO|nr:major facilitator superfamily domain-containing protein [Dactylonectria estremocensis]